MVRVFVIATTPMQFAGLRAMLTSSEIEIGGEHRSFQTLRWKSQKHFRYSTIAYATFVQLLVRRVFLVKE